MTDWISFIDDSNDFFNSYDVPPSLESAFIRRAKWELGDPNSISIDLYGLPLPQRLPISWRRMKKYNHCAIELQFFDVKNITSVSSTCDKEINSLPLKIFTQDNILFATIHMTYEGIHITFSFSRVVNVKVFGYQ
jgi:hypothetical protein